MHQVHKLSLRPRLSATVKNILVWAMEAALSSSNSAPFHPIYMSFVATNDIHRAEIALCIMGFCDRRLKERR
eukprot:scaffold301706_cov15-Prasinocladus_malaysianus.AAC.1